MAAAILGDAPDSFVAVGFSMGGYVARELARIAPERVTALILIATSARGDTDELIRQRRSALKAAPRAFKGLSRPAIVSSLHPDLAGDDAMISRVRDMGLRLGGEVFHRQSAMARAGDLDRLDEITQPTLIVTADADRLRGPEEAEELHQGIKGATLVHIARSGHMIPLEQPQALAKVMTDWLARLPVT
jgi:pimeloyl-ACP methyl ester carboxylesterase